MNIEQQNRNVTEVFEWNDASLLTGDIRLGAEMCSDRKVDAQVKTQIELDKEAFNAYDKLYPGDFMINVEQSVIDDIIPIKTNVVTESGDKSIVYSVILSKSIHYLRNKNYKIHNIIPTCLYSCIV